MTWTIIKITKIDDHQKLSAPLGVAKQLFAKTATVFAAESVSQKGNEVNIHIHTQGRPFCAFLPQEQQHFIVVGSTTSLCTLTYLPIAPFG